MAGKLRVEGWTLPSTGTFERKFFHVPVVGGTGRRELSAWHSASLDIPRSWSRLPDLLSGTLLRVYDGSMVVDEIVAERMPQELRTDSTVTVTGPQIGGLLSKVGVYPPDYGLHNPPKRPNWVWDGKNIAGPLNLEDLAHIKAEYELFISGERYRLDKSGASAGTFTLTVEGNETDPIDWDAGERDIQSALEALGSVDVVTVIHDRDARHFTIVFDAPKNLSTDMTMDDSQLTGSATLTKLNDGFDPDSNPTFTVTVAAGGDSDTTEELAWNVSAQALEGVSETLVPPGSGLQGLSTVDDVRVSGSGTAADPWVIVFYLPPVVTSVSVSFSAGTAVVTETVEGRLDPSPVTQSMEADQRIDELIHGTYSDPPIEVVTDPSHLDTGADWALKVNALSQFAGSQRIFSVIPGELYQAKIRVKPTVTGDYTLVFRDLAGNFIQNTAPRHIRLTADEYGDLIVADLVIPDGVNQVIMRVAVVDFDSSAWAPFYVNWQHAELVLGLPPATPGDIVKTLLEHAQARGTATWLEPSFDESADTASTAWPAVHSYQADGFAMYLSDVLADMADLGYEWTITPKASPSNGYTHDLNLWVSGGAGADRTTTGPTLTSGGSVVGGEIVDRIPAFTAGVGWGADDLFAEHTDTDLASKFGRLERFFDAEQHHDADSLEDLLERMFSDDETNRQAGNVELSGSGSVVPFVHFDVGDTLVWQVPPAMEKNERRVQTISWQHGPVAKYEVQGSRVWGEASPLEAIIRLLDAPKKRPRFHPDNPLILGGGGGIPDVVVAASNTKFKEDADLVCPGNGLDHLTIQQALDRLPSSGGWVHLLEGDYYFTASALFGYVTTGPARVKFTGAGVNITRIWAADGANTPCLLELNRIGGVFIFEDFTLDGNKSSATVSSALLKPSPGILDGQLAASVYVNRVTMRNCDGVGVGTSRTASTWRFEQVTVTGCNNGGLLLAESTSFHVQCQYSNNGGPGFSAGTLGTYHLFNGCHISGNDGQGISSEGLTAGCRFIVTGSRITNNGSHGVVANDFNNPGVVVGNVIVGNGGRSVIMPDGSMVAANVMSGNGTDTPSPDNGNIVDGEQTGGGGLDTATFSSDPGAELVVGQGSFRFVAPSDGELRSVVVAVGDPATGADVIVDVNKGGTTVFTTQANRPTVPAGANDGAVASPDVTAVVAGDWFTVDVDQVGSTYGGADLTVTLQFAWEAT